MREIFAVDDFLKNVANDHELENQKKLVVAYDNAVRALVGPNDMQIEMVWSKAERKEVEREFKKKSAWKKLARHFRIDVTEVSHRVFFVEDEDKGFADNDRHLVAEVKMRGVAPWGQVVETLGACTTFEKRFGKDKTKAWHDCLATAQTRASNRAISDLIAAGEVSAEEITPEAQAQEREKKSDTSTKAAPDSRKSKPAREKRMPMGHNRGKALGEIDTKDLEGAAKWCRENNKYPDLVSAIADVLAERQKDQGKLELEAKAPANPRSAGEAAVPSTREGASSASSAAADKQLPANRTRWTTAQLQARALELLKDPLLAGIQIDPTALAQLQTARMNHGDLVKMVTYLEQALEDFEAASENASANEDDDLPF